MKGLNKYPLREYRSGISGSLIVCIIILEYIAVFHGRNGFHFSQQEIYLLTGYLLLTILITCNHHGMDRIVRYEQGLNLILRSIAANLIMLVFLCGLEKTGLELQSGPEPSEWNICKGMLLLSVLQIVSIVILCRIGSCRKKRNGDRQIILYGERVPDVSSRRDAACLSIMTSDMELLKRQICAHDTIYLYDIATERRNDLLKFCFENRKPVFFTAKLSDIELYSADLLQDGETPVFYQDIYRISRLSAFGKRLFDLVFSTVFLILLLPLFAVIALCIRLEDGQGVFYYQTRCTKDGKEFRIIKFRSMVTGVEAQPGIQLAAKGDARLTRIGYILRKYRLDELPQLINILKGDMSFVGPRPERPERIQEIQKQIPEFSFRTAVKAGLTGYAQVHGGYHINVLDKLKWDLIYIENQSMLLDLKIIFMTIPAVLQGSEDV